MVWDTGYSNVVLVNRIETNLSLVLIRIYTLNALVIVHLKLQNSSREYCSGL